MLIGLIGTNGAGKSLVCGYLEKKGFTVMSLSDIVRQHALEKKLPLCRDSLTATANELKKIFGPEVLAKKVWESLPVEKTTLKIVFDSIRHPAEMQYLQQHGTLFWGIDADVSIRYERVQKRKKETDLISFETFQRQDNQENTGLSFGQNIQACLANCQFFFQNNGSENALFEKIDPLLKELI